MTETPQQRYERRLREEVEAPLNAATELAENKSKEIKTELEAAQKVCSPHKDDGGMFYGFCKLCGKDLG
jgi:hypothetical protein